MGAVPVGVVVGVGGGVAYAATAYGDYELSGERADPWACYWVRAKVNDTTEHGSSVAYAKTVNSDHSCSSGNGGVTVGVGWLGAAVDLTKKTTSGEALCANAGWAYNTTSGINFQRNANWKSSCGHGNFRSLGFGQGWLGSGQYSDPNLSTSPWLGL